MRFRPTPKGASFFKLFRKTAHHLEGAATTLAQILGADAKEREELAVKLHDLEQAADASTHEVHIKLNSTFVTPFDRTDIYDLASRLDDCVDHMDEAGNLIVLYKLADLPEGITKQVEILQRCAELTGEAMPKLNNIADLDDYWVEINRLENQADQVYLQLLSEILADGADPLQAIKLKSVIDLLEAGADCFEGLANVIEAIHLKES